MADEKEFKNFDKEISNILSTSKGASNWTDLLTFTKKIHELLSKKENDFNFNLITDKVILSKRLAQCLHPECPKGVHKVVIDIYDILFKNILEKNDGKLGENLSIFHREGRQLDPALPLLVLTTFATSVIYALCRYGL